MGTKYFKIVPLIFILSLLFLSCEEYTGYNIEADLTKGTTRVQGTIKNFNTGEPVASAGVRVGQYNTVTDESGKFQVSYEISEDDTRNKPVPFRVDAYNYYSYHKEFLLAPVTNEINIRLHYAAPVIKRHYRGWHLSSSFVNYMVIQAEIVDYQGIDTIDSVRATLFITDGEQIVEIYRNMKRIRKINDVTAWYQNYDTPKTFRDWELLEMFRIKVVDEEGYIATASEANVGVVPLFQPDLP